MSRSTYPKNGEDSEGVDDRDQSQRRRSLPHPEEAYRDRSQLQRSTPPGRHQSEADYNDRNRRRRSTPTNYWRGDNNDDRGGRRRASIDDGGRRYQRYDLKRDLYSPPSAGRYRGDEDRIRYTREDERRRGEDRHDYNRGRERQQSGPLLRSDNKEDSSRGHRSYNEWHDRERPPRDYYGDRDRESEVNKRSKPYSDYNYRDDYYRRTDRDYRDRGKENYDRNGKYNAANTERRADDHDKGDRRQYEPSDRDRWREETRRREGEYYHDRRRRRTSFDDDDRGGRRRHSQSDSRHDNRGGRTHQSPHSDHHARTGSSSQDPNETVSSSSNRNNFDSRSSEAFPAAGEPYRVRRKPVEDDRRVARSSSPVNVISPAEGPEAKSFVRSEDMEEEGGGRQETESRGRSSTGGSTQWAIVRSFYNFFKTPSGTGESRAAGSDSRPNDSRSSRRSQSEQQPRRRTGENRRTSGSSGEKSRRRESSDRRRESEQHQRRRNSEVQERSVSRMDQSRMVGYQLSREPSHLNLRNVKSSGYGKVNKDYLREKKSRQTYHPGEEHKTARETHHGSRSVGQPNNTEVTSHGSRQSDSVKRSRHGSKLTPVGF